MEIKSLQNRKKINGGLYDLYTTIILENKEFAIYEFPLTGRHDMRIDLVSLDIYEDTNQIDLLCKVNDIINPLTVQKGDIILFIEPDDIEEIRSSDDIVLDVLEKIKDANSGKQHKIDKNRQEDLRNRKQKEKAKKLLPPNILDASNKNLRTEDGKIKRSPNF